MKIIARNKKARHDYEIEKTFEAGIVLTGPEVKSLRQGKIGFADSFAKIKKGELFLYNLNIPPHNDSSFFNHEPTRIRKLLMHKLEIKRFQKKIEQAGYTLVPIEIYFNNRGLVKIKIALVKGKRTPDKKQALKTAQLDREAKRAMKNFR